MIDLQTLLDTIDELPAEALSTVEHHLEQRRQAIEQVRWDDDAETWIADLRAALAEFREGLSERKLNEITADMILGYISPKELALFDQLGEEDETEDAG